MESDNITIRYAHREIEEWEQAMQLAWSVFLKFEAAEYGKEGTDNFLDFIAGEQLYQMFLNGDYALAVAEYEGCIVGMATMRSGNHISLLFVDEKFHRKGIGTRLLAFLQEGLGRYDMTVNASPYGIDFYRNVGFKPTVMELQHADGISFLPMTCIVKIIKK